MHTIDKRNQFVKRRAEGHSLRDIAEEIGIAKSTAALWDQQEQDRITRIMYVDQEIMMDESGQTWAYQMGLLQRYIRKLEESFDGTLDKHLKYMKPKDQYQLMAMIRADMHNLLVKLPPLPGSQAEIDALPAEPPPKNRPTESRSNPAEAEDSTPANGHAPRNGSPDILMINPSETPQAPPSSDSGNSTAA
jgi:hypothetical protein